MENENIVENIKIVTLSNLMKDCPNVLEYFYNNSDSFPFTWGDCNRSLIHLDFFDSLLENYINEEPEMVKENDPLFVETTKFLIPRVKSIIDKNDGIIYVDLEN